MNQNIKNKMGIYQIVNLIDGKKYIGSSNNLYKRKMHHFWSLRSNKHDNSYLQRAFNKHGEANFSFEVIEFVNTIDELLPREQYYIELYQVCDRNKGYNLIVDAVRGTHSEENKRKISLAQRGKKMSEEAKRKLSESKRGKYGGEKHPMYGKHHSLESRRKMSLAQKGRQSGSKNPMYGIRGALNPNSKKVICVETGVVYDGLAEAGRVLGICRKSISHCCRGKSKTAGGYHWKFYTP